MEHSSSPKAPAHESALATAPAPAPAKATSTTYLSNPFLVVSKGVVTILKNNPVPALLLSLVLSAIGFGGFIIFAILMLAVGKGDGVFLVFLLGWVALIVLSALSLGSYLSVGTASTKKQTITTEEALRRANKKLLPLIGLGLLRGLATGVGFLLLVVPGFIVLGRLSLAGVILMEENLGVTAALKRSWELTRGHTMEMLGALFASTFFSGGGLIAPTVAIAPLFGRYQDLVELEKSGQAAPETHWLNYLALVCLLPFVLFAIVLGFGMHNLSENERHKQKLRPDDAIRVPSDINLNGDYRINGGDPQSGATDPQPTYDYGDNSVMQSPSYQAR